MTMTINQTDGQHGHRSPEEIAELFEIAGRETEAIRQLTGWVAELLEVQAAKDSLMALTPAEVRAALAYRHPALWGTTT